MVTVILPTYQRAGILSQAIESVLAQSYRDWELLVIDDGSTDDTGSLVSGYEQADQRIRYIFQENKGVAGARNLGIEQAKGEFVAFIDSDDVWLEHKLKNQIDAMKDGRYALTAGDVSYPDGGSFFDRHPLPPDNNLAWLFVRNFIATSTVLARRSAIEQVGGFNEQIMICEDYDLWMRLTERNAIHISDEVLACYRTQPDSMTADRKRYLQDLLKVKKKFINSQAVRRLSFLDRYNAYYRYRLALIRHGWLKK